MSTTLTPERLAEIRSNVLAKDVFNERVKPARAVDILDGYVDDLLAELYRITPQWVPVAAGQHKYSQEYEVAGTTSDSPTPVWLGKGRYYAESGLWFDSDEGKPFPKSTTITHFYKQLAPHEAIGQPTL